MWNKMPPVLERCQPPKEEEIKENQVNVREPFEENRLIRALPLTAFPNLKKFKGEE